MGKDKKILTSKEWIPDINGNGIETVITVYYDRGRDAFYVNCPAHLLENGPSVTKQQIEDGPIETKIADGRIYADRAAGAIKKLLSQGYQYRHAIQKKRKVIAYQVQYNEDMLFERGVGLLVDWRIGWELKIGDRVEILSIEPPDEINTYVCNQTYLFDSHEEGIKIIDWTDDREKFFEGLTEALEGLKIKCRSFLDDEIKLALAIDMGISPLLIEGEKP